MRGSSSDDPKRPTRPPSAAYRPPIERIGAALWALALVSILIVATFLDPAEIGSLWRTHVLTGLRVFAGVFAFFAIFPIIHTVRSSPNR